MNADAIQILDCTLRDGGLGLEDASGNGENVLQFTESSIDGFIRAIKRSDIDIVEIGAIEITDGDETRFAIYHDIESVSRKIPADKPSNQMYAALYRGPDTPIEDIPYWNKNLCEVVRVIIRYSELRKSLDFCKALAAKGYKVCVQPMVTMRYTDEELQTLIDAANDMCAYALYLVDSYGYMREGDVLSLFRRFDAGLDRGIRIGFHAHNNMNLAFANVSAFVSLDSDRKVIVDSTVLGMGQGAGNLQTELFVAHLNQVGSSRYRYDAVLDACEIIEEYWSRNLWGYSVAHLLPAIHKTAYKFSVSLRNTYGLTYSQINHILMNIPEDMRHRYTPENTLKLLEIFGHAAKANA